MKIFFLITIINRGLAHSAEKEDYLLRMMTGAPPRSRTSLLASRTAIWHDTSNVIALSKRRFRTALTDPSGKSTLPHDRIFILDHMAAS